MVLATVSGPQTPLARMITGVTGWHERIVHANGDPLDCRRANLIVKTFNEQTFGNRKKGSVNGRKYTSSFKGVCWSEERGKWVAQIVKDGKHRLIGRFYEEIDAAQAYDEAARELFGEHAWLNFPNEGERGFADAATSAFASGSDDQSLNPRIAA